MPPTILLPDYEEGLVVVELDRVDFDIYRVTHQVVQNLPLPSKQKARPKRNFCFEVNGRFCTT